jgi:hypothetical protein
MTKRRLRPWQKLLLGLFVIIGLYAGYTYARQWYWERELAQYLTELTTREPGWDWDSRFGKLQALKPEENAAMEVRAILRLLTLDESRNLLGKIEWSNSFFNYESQSRNDEVHTFLADHPNALLPGANRETLATLLSGDPWPEAVSRINRLRQFPASRFEHKYRRILAMTLLPDVQAVRNLSRLLNYSVEINLAKGDATQAVADIHAMLGLLRVYDNDPFYITSLVRYAILQQAIRAMQRWLGQTVAPSPALLRQMQEELQSAEAALPNLAEMIRWDRAVIDHDLKLLHSGELSLREYLEEQNKSFATTVNLTGWKSLDKTIVAVYPQVALGLWAHPRDYARERLHHLRYHELLMSLVTLPEEQWIAAVEKAAEQGAVLTPFVYCLQHLGTSREDYLKNRQRYVTTMARVQLTGRANCRTMMAALALERYRVEHGVWPTSLEALTPKYLPAPLVDPFTGKPLLFKTFSDGVMVYSVGYNGVDDGGRIFPVDKQNTGDIGYRLWNVTERRKDMTKEMKESLSP